MAEAAVLDKSAAVLSAGYHLMSQPGQDLLEIIAHIRFVVGNDDAQTLIGRHGHSRGKVMWIWAPAPLAEVAGSPTVIRPLWAWTIRLAIAMPKPVPLVFVVKKGSNMRWRCSEDKPGPLSHTWMCRAGRPSRCIAVQDTSSTTGSLQAARVFSMILRKTCSRRKWSTEQCRSRLWVCSRSTASRSLRSMARFCQA